MVTTNASMTEGDDVECSGVLIAPRLVLTAASCICARHPPNAPSPRAETTLEASACARDTAVSFATYEEPTHGFKAMIVDYKGRARPHPRFKMVLSGDGAVMSSTADLAVVMLGTHVNDVVPPPLADTEAKVGEPLLAVGYPSYAERGGVLRKRLFGKSEVTGPASPGEGVRLINRFRQRTSAGLGGGPCFREAGGGIALVGIMSGQTSEHPLLTSVQPYRDWLLNEIRQSEGPR
jgi:hypothetical protein